MISARTLRELYRELTPRQDGRPLVVGGARALAPLLRRELGVEGGDDPRGASVYVHVWAGDGSDEAQLKRARRARVPIVALAPEEVESLPWVLATAVVRSRPGESFPVGGLARAIARRLGEDAAPLAAQVPALRRAVAEQVVERTARRNGLVAAAVFVPGVDMPILLRNELRMLTRLEQIYGRQLAPGSRLPELVGTFAVGFGLRTAARELLDLVPGGAEGDSGVPAGRRRLGRRRSRHAAGWAVKGGVAYAGTRALGQAALRRLEGVSGQRGR
ncbi:MAG TPA: DUF697 domain-containing protein [Gaiellaceae bacterium]|nr:DUF697 domain-containing protein [Gaiellaceae bacterium]